LNAKVVQKARGSPSGGFAESGNTPPAPAKLSPSKKEAADTFCCVVSVDFFHTANCGGGFFFASHRAVVHRISY
jgi:hypothetical protein